MFEVFELKEWRWERCARVGRVGDIMWGLNAMRNELKFWGFGSFQIEAVSCPRN